MRPPMKNNLWIVALAAVVLAACGGPDNSKSDAGTSACATASDCPGQDTECGTRKCSAGKCGFDYAAAGTVMAQQTAGDCAKNVCDGQGGGTVAADDADVPGNTECITYACQGGVLQTTD